MTIPLQQLSAYLGPVKHSKVINDFIKCIVKL